MASEKIFRPYAEKRDSRNRFIGLFPTGAAGALLAR